MGGGSSGEQIRHQRATDAFETQRRSPMATNAPAGDGHRKGFVRKRTQLKTKVMGEDHYTKRNKKNGEFVAQKKGEKKFKGVRREKVH
jgi:hypothetical protein